MKKITMKNLPISERPYEKLLNSGVDTLSDAELLAIIIKNGTKNLTAIDISRRLLLLCDNNLSNLCNFEIEQLKKIEGIGKVKAIQTKAVLELAKRIAKPNINEKKKIKKASDVFELLKYECINEKREKIFVLNLNVKLDVIKITKIASGGQARIGITMKEIFVEPIRLEADSIILVHNHPSGDTKPSNHDIEFTLKAVETGKLMDIEVIDHVIISNNEYTSMKEGGII